MSRCPEAISRPLLKACLTEKQWEAVILVNHALRQEYECRRQMLLQRLDVTILSFQWSDRAKVSAHRIYLCMLKCALFNTQTLMFQNVTLYIVVSHCLYSFSLLCFRCSLIFVVELPCMSYNLHVYVKSFCTISVVFV